MTKKFLSQGQAETLANDVIRPFLGELSVQTIEDMIPRLAAAFKRQSYASYQRGLDHVDRPGAQHKKINVRTPEGESL